MKLGKHIERSVRNVKHWSIFVLILVLIYNSTLCYGEEEKAFLFRGKETWGMTMNEIIDIEGEGKQSTVANGLLFLEYENVQFSKYYGWLQYRFAEDSLIVCGYATFEEPVHEINSYLAKALCTVYGEEEHISASDSDKLFKWLNNDSVEIDIFTPLYESSHFWRCSDGTLIMLFSDDNVTGIFYMSPKAIEMADDDYIDTTGL